MVGGDTLGALVCKTADGTEFKIGTGFNASQRAKLWSMRDELKGQLVKYKFQELSKYGVPRFPVFIELRDRRDL